MKENIITIFKNVLILYFKLFQVSSYNPRTTHGDHQIFVYINAQDAETVYLPVVPTKLGDITINIKATTLITSDQISRTLHVEVCLFFINILVCV